MTLDVTQGTSGRHAPEGAWARQVRQRLEDERRNREEQLANLGQSDEGLPDDTVLAQADSLRQTLEEVEEALRRLDRGEYGVCEGCAKPIPEGRLEILPYARYCVSCQQRRRGRS